MLCRVADDRHQDHPHEDLGHAPGLGGRLNRADEKFAHHRDEGGCDEQHRGALLDRPALGSDRVVRIVAVTAGV